MDDCLAQVAIDFGGRNWLVWNAEFKREMIGKIISEMGEISMKEMGNVMSALKDQAGSKIDMKLASQMVREIISKQSD